ncbi:MAG: PAS domain S-box protein, partial [Syntrophus sp. (in: bacteria)]
EELRRSQLELDTARARYFDLYDLAPVGYCTISEKGLILEANLTVATMLGLTHRGALAERPLSQYIFKEDHDIYYLHRKQLFETDEPQPCELRMVKMDGTLFWACLETTAAKGTDGAPTYRMVISNITGRIETEKELRKSQKQLRNAHRLAHIGIWNWNADTDTVIWTEELYRIAGLDPMNPAPTYAEHGHIYAPESWDRLKVAVAKALKTGAPYQLELELILPNGTTRWVNTFGGATFDNQGRITGLQGTVQDITERKQAEEGLRKSEARLRAILDATPFPVALVDTQDKIIDFWSHSALTLFGHTAPTTDEWYQIAYPDPDYRREVIDRWKPFLEIAQESNQTVNTGEYRVTCSDGSVRICELYATFLSDKLIVTFNDITERKLAEEALCASQQILEGIINAIPVRVFWKDKNLVFLGCNALFARDAGFTDPKDIIGKDDYQMVWRDQAGLYRGDDRQVIESGGSKFFIEEPQKTPEGTTITVLTSKVPLRSSTGEISGVLGTYMDITSRKQAEEEKRSLEERLNRAEKMESLGTLAGGVAHDLNNVLGIVVGYAEMLMDELDEANPMRGDLEKILEGGNRSAAIVQDLLTLARRGVQTKKTVNLNATITDCQKLPEFEKVFSDNRQVKLQADFESDLLNIIGSPVHLAKSIINLAANAVEAMPNGGVLKIATANQYLDVPIQGYDKIREGDYVVLTVSDTGEGISERDIKRIFEPFYTKKIMGRSGTGLGLAVVWGTIKDHNGYINVESTEGKGTTFTLYFPVTREEMESEQISVSMSEYMGNGETILIVDDINRQRELASRMLSKLNYSVSAVASGEEAVEYLKTNKADLIVLDMIMDPGIDGLETYEKILEISPAQKAVIVSGFSESDRVKEAQRIGAGAYVRKPYVLERLGVAVRKELDRK